MLVIGSDSHTCSAGSVSALAIGLGVADVLLPLVTGETWFRIPETVNIRFINQPRPGIGGKDVILYILKELKRNTVASDRIVEYTGPGVEHLSCDARFAIANMTTVRAMWCEFDKLESAARTPLHILLLAPYTDNDKGIRWCFWDLCARPRHQDIH